MSLKSKPSSSAAARTLARSCGLANPLWFRTRLAEARRFVTTELEARAHVPMTRLSGGEAQRVKLSTELSKRSTGKTLYLLDEPTTGLHFDDVKKLLELLHRLVERGNTVLVVEHNLDVVKTADWIVDLGPEGGDAGGEIVSVGPPEAVAADPRSHTGRFLAPVLGRTPAVAAPALRDA